MKNNIKLYETPYELLLLKSPTNPRQVQVTLLKRLQKIKYNIPHCGIVFISKSNKLSILWIKSIVKVNANFYIFVEFWNEILTNIFNSKWKRSFLYKFCTIQLFCRASSPQKYCFRFRFHFSYYLLKVPDSLVLS